MTQMERWNSKPDTTRTCLTASVNYRHISGSYPGSGQLGQDLRAESTPAIAQDPARIGPQALHGVRRAAQPRKAKAEEDTEWGGFQGIL